MFGRRQLPSPDVGSGATSAPGPADPVLCPIFGSGSSIIDSSWDIAPDGQRILFSAGSTDTGTSLVTVVLNWQAGLKPVVDRP